MYADCKFATRIGTLHLSDISCGWKNANKFLNKHCCCYRGPLVNPFCKFLGPDPNYFGGRGEEKRQIHAEAKIFY